METFTEIFATYAGTAGGIQFAHAPEQAVDFPALGARLRGNAEHFRRLGVGPGDRVAIAMSTDLEHLVALLALMAVGAVPLSVKPRREGDAHYAQTLARMLAAYEVRFRYHTLPELPGVRAIAWDPRASSSDLGAVARVDAQAPCFVQFSSGSLGAPKPIPISHRALLANIEAIVATDSRTQDTLGYNFLPLSHDMGLVGVLTALFVRHRFVLAPPQRFLRKPVEFFSQHGAGQSCVMAMPDFALRYLARFLAARRGAPDPQLLSCVHNVYCGAEPIRYETIEELLAAAVPWGLDPRALIFAYGMAEATLLATARRFSSLDESFTSGALGQRIANLGGPPPGTEVCVGRRRVGCEIELAGPGEQGTVFVRGPSVFRGYLDGEPPPGGWHDTGDLGFAGEGGLFVVGRADDLIIVNGENIFPGDVEAVVMRATGVRDCVVMAEERGFSVLVVAKPGASVDPSEVAAAVGAQFGVLPNRTACGGAADILRTTSGKPMRRATLAQLRQRQAA